MLHRAHSAVDVGGDRARQPVVPMVDIVKGATFDRQKFSVDPFHAVSVDHGFFKRHARVPSGDFILLGYAVPRGICGEGMIDASKGRDGDYSRKY